MGDINITGGQQGFNRYEGAADNADTGVRMPSSELDAKVSNLCLSELLGRLENFTGKERAMYPWATRFAMGFPLPSWQRPLVWSDRQKVGFIQSIWSGVDVGSYMINDQYEFVGINADSFKELSGVLLDGQQRLTAIEDYVMNKFAVPDEGGVLRFWRDLPRIERRRFGGFHFARANVRSLDEDLLRLAYDLRSFGGTAHTEDQRACRPQVK